MSNFEKKKLKSTIYLMFYYETIEQRDDLDHQGFQMFNSLQEIEKNYKIPLKTLSKICVGEIKGSHGEAKKFMDKWQLIKVHPNRIQDYNNTIQDAITYFQYEC